MIDIPVIFCQYPRNLFVDNGMDFLNIYRTNVFISRLYKAMTAPDNDFVAFRQNSWQDGIDAYTFQSKALGISFGIEYDGKLLITQPFETVVSKHRAKKLVNLVTKLMSDDATDKHAAAVFLCDVVSRKYPAHTTISSKEDLLSLRRTLRAYPCKTFIIVKKSSYLIYFSDANEAVKFKMSVQ